MLGVASTSPRPPLQTKERKTQKLSLLVSLGRPEVRNTMEKLCKNFWLGVGQTSRIERKTERKNRINKNQSLCNTFVNNKGFYQLLLL